MITKKFEAAVEMGHKGCGIVLPFAPSAAWGTRPRHFVRGTIDGVRFEAETGCRWGRHFISVRDDVMTALGLESGGRVQMTMTSRPANANDPAEAPKLPEVRLTGSTTKRSRAPRPKPPPKHLPRGH